MQKTLLSFFAASAILVGGSLAEVRAQAESVVVINERPGTGEQVIWDESGDGDGPPNRVWAIADSLLWWIRGDRLPPLVTTSPPGTPVASAGVIGAPGTSVVIGDQSVNGEPRFGGRFTIGYWFDCEQKCGVEASYFLLEGKAFHSGASSTGDPILARPFINGITGKNDAELVAFLGIVAGSVNVDDPSSTLSGPEVLFRCNVCCGCCYRVDVLGGWRYLHMKEGLGINENLTSTAPLALTGIVPGTNIIVNDRFDTSNTFNGGEIGVDASYIFGKVALDLRAKLAVGVNDQTVDINGNTFVNEPGLGTAFSQGGFLALSTNIGHYHREPTVVIPELDLNLCYNITSNTCVRLGYTFIYWPSLFRPAEQIDPVVNPTFLPNTGAPPTGPARPAPVLGEKDMWVQGINLGLEIRY